MKFEQLRKISGDENVAHRMAERGNQTQGDCEPNSPTAC
jgi:hypothetical protein